MSDPDLPEQHIRVSENGPYLVSGGPTLGDHQDGTHADVGWRADR